MADREAESRANPDGLGREEWIEDSFESLRVDAATGVADLDGRAARVIRARDDPELVAVGLAFADRLRTVHEKIDEHLPEPRLIGLDEWHGVVVLHEPRTVLDLVQHHVDRGLEDRLEIEHDACLGVGARECAKSTHDLPHAFRAVPRFAHHVRELGHPARQRSTCELANLFRDQLEVHHHVGERVVDLVRDSSRKGAEG